MDSAKRKPLESAAASLSRRPGRERLLTASTGWFTGLGTGDFLAGVPPLILMGVYGFAGEAVIDPPE